MATPSFLRGFLSLAQVAERFAVDRSTVTRWCALWTRTKGREGLGPVVRLGRRCVRVDVQDVAAFVVRMSEPKRENVTSSRPKMGGAVGTPGAKGRAVAGGGSPGTERGKWAVDGVSTVSHSEVVAGKSSSVVRGGLCGGDGAETGQAGGGVWGARPGGGTRGDEKVNRNFVCKANL